MCGGDDAADADGDPSVHPKTATIFLSRSASDRHRKSTYWRDCR